MFIERPALDKHLEGLITPATKIIEAGCGSGRTIDYLLQLGAQIPNIIGIDSSQEMLALAKVRVPSGRFIYGDLANVQLPEQMVDLITCNMVLNQVGFERLDPIMRNFYTWLKPEGHLLYVIPHPIRMVYTEPRNYFNRIERLDPSPWGTLIPYFHRTIADYFLATTKVGFSVLVLDEPEVKPEGRSDLEMFERHTTYPSRLIVKAAK